MAEQTSTTEIEQPTREVSRESAKKQDGAYWSVGRRKTAVARVKMQAGKGEIIVNGHPLEEYYAEQLVRATVMAPLAAVERQDTFDVSVKVAGGGKMSQAGAIAHGVARALLQYDAVLRPQLKKEKLLTRDSRMKERKKYGLKRARKAPQFSKR